MKKIISIQGIVLIILLAGLGDIFVGRLKQNAAVADDPQETESPGARLDRFRADLPGVVAAACTNDVTGLRSIIKINADDTGTVVTKWSALATVDFLNESGGVSRTNLNYQFNTTMGELYCWKVYQ